MALTKKDNGDEKKGAVPVEKPGQKDSAGHQQKAGEPVQKDPKDAEKNREEIKEAQKNITEPPDDQNVADDDPMNKTVVRDSSPDERSGHPKTVKTAESADKESGPSKAERVDTATPSDTGEKDPQAWKGKNMYVMTNVDGEKLNITPLQWEKHGQILMNNGWTEPVFAKEGKITAGSEPIPQNINWGKDTP